MEIKVEQMRQGAQAQQAQQETMLEAQRNAQDREDQMALEKYKADLEVDKAVRIAEIQAMADIRKAEIMAASRPQSQPGDEA